MMNLLKVKQLVQKAHFDEQGFCPRTVQQYLDAMRRIAARCRGVVQGKKPVQQNDLIFTGIIYTANHYNGFCSSCRQQNNPSKIV